MRRPTRIDYPAAHEVHVWRIDVASAAASVSALREVLTSEETERAGRFYFARDREAYIITHGALRYILSGYLDAEPAQVRFAYGRSGKPALAPEIGGEDLRFNLSHTDGVALLGVTRRRELGIDVERVRGGVAGEKIAERFFSPREVATLRGLPANVQDEAFFACWTRKEAYVKARGEGLSLPLDRFDVTLGPDEPPRLLHVLDDPAEASRWSLYDLGLRPAYCAALVVEGTVSPLTWLEPEL